MFQSLIQEAIDSKDSEFFRRHGKNFLIQDIVLYCNDVIATVSYELMGDEMVRVAIKLGSDRFGHKEARSSLGEMYVVGNVEFIQANELSIIVDRERRPHRIIWYVTV